MNRASSSGKTEELAFLPKAVYTTGIVVKKQTKKSQVLTKKLQHHTRKAVVPHKVNQYRPRVIGRWGLLVVIMAVFVTFIVHNTVQTGDVLGRETNVRVADLLVSMNEERVSEGLQPLAVDNRLSDAAYKKAINMLQQQYWSHESPEGVKPWKWLADSGYNYTEAGENLARGFNTGAEITQAWMASPSHRSNVLGASYQDVGFAVVEGVLEGKSTTLVVAMYGTPITAVAGLTAPAPSFYQSNAPVGMVASIGYRIQTLPPVAVGTVALVLFMSLLAFVAHGYRHKLPKSLKQSWYRHHGLYKGVGLACFGGIIVIMYSSGGQI